MRKQFVILIVIGAIVVVATPTIFLSIYFIAQNRLDNVNVEIEGIEVTGLTDDTLSGTVNFTINDPTTVDATFKILTFNIVNHK